MTISRNDIKIRHNDNANVVVWLSEHVVVNRCGVSEGYLRKRCRPLYKKSLPESWRKPANNREFFLGNTGKAWRFGYKDGLFWYDIDQIPDRAPTFYRLRLPTKSELIDVVTQAGGTLRSRERWTLIKSDVKEKVEDLIRMSDVSYYMRYDLQVTGGKAFPARKARELAESVAWVTFIKESLENGYYRSLGFKMIKEFYESMASLIAERKLEGLKVSTGRSLRNKIEVMESERSAIRKALVSKKYNNNNAAILGKKSPIADTETGEVKDIAVHETLMLAYYMNFGGAGKGTKIELYKQYLSAMNELEERPVSLSLFTKYLGTSYIQEMTAAQRHGKEYFSKMVLTYVPSRKLEYANSLWCADASGTLSYRYYTKSGQVKTRKLYTVLVNDVASGYVVGYAVGKEKVSSENYNTMREAIAKAVSNPLNDRKRVLEFLSDNHGAYTSAKSKEYLQLVAQRVRTIAPHNSQANPAERLFRVFKCSLRGLYNLFDTSFAAQDIENQANPDYFTTERLPTYEEAKRQFEEVINTFNNRLLGDGTTPQERFINAKNPTCDRYNEQEYRLITTKGKEMNLAKARGIFQVTKGGMATRYELPIDTERKAVLAKHAGYSTRLDVIVYADGEQADLYDTEGAYLMTVKRAKEACISTYEATDEERRIHKYHEQRKERQRQEVADFEGEVLESFEHLRRGDRFDLEMAANRYSKEEYNNRQEELIRLKTPEKEKREKERRHLELIKKKHARYTNKEFN